MVVLRAAVMNDSFDRRWAASCSECTSQNAVIPDFWHKALRFWQYRKHDEDLEGQ
jgi:hypothetical protein